MEPSTTPQSGKPGLFGKLLKIAAVAGLVALVFTGMRERQKQKQAMDDMNETRRVLNEDMKRELDENGTISADTSAKAMEKMRGKFEKIASQGGRDDKAMKAASEVMGELQAKAVPYIALIKRIETDNPMDMVTVKDKADLAARRQFGKDMLRMNQELITFINSVEPNLREKIGKLGASGSATEEFVTGFMKGYGKSATIQRRIRKSDETIAKALIAMTDLMEAEWGKWAVKEHAIEFDSDAALKRFNELIDETVKAGDEQTAAQRELLELQQRK